LFNIEYLTKKTGVSRRTVRYYIQRGLLPPPLGRKRGSYYTEAHLERLQLILRLSDQGVPLIQIKKILDSESPENTPAPVRKIIRRKFEKVEISSGIELITRPEYFDDIEITQIKEFILKLLEEKKHDQ
jgi:DNA-binding transcriptional MerR regulator